MVFSSQYCPQLKYFFPHMFRIRSSKIQAINPEAKFWPLGMVGKKSTTQGNRMIHTVKQYLIRVVAIRLLSATNTSNFQWRTMNWNHQKLLSSHFLWQFLGPWGPDICSGFVWSISPKYPKVMLQTAHHVSKHWYCQQKTSEMEKQEKHQTALSGGNQYLSYRLVYFSYSFVQSFHCHSIILIYILFFWPLSPSSNASEIQY